jgi:acylphosphatase
VSDEIIAVHVRIEGKVQRVWYRNWTVEQAGLRGLSGWVRNRLDGSVEALFAGSKVQVDSMIEACREGPPKARVDNIIATPAEIPAEPGFREAETV